MLKLWMLATGLVVFAIGVDTLPAQETELRYLSGKGKDDPVKWEFHCSGGQNSGRWTTIDVPSNWELQGFGTYNYGQDKTKASEQGRYRYTFEVSKRWKDKAIYIVFEGVMTDTQVWINGKSAGPEHQGGFYRFKYNITRLVKFTGDNLLEVTVNKVSSNASVEAAGVFAGLPATVY
jgi:beta-galactosidase/beta-glucuronidase